MKTRYAFLLLGIVALSLVAMYLSAQREGYLVVDVPGATLQLNSWLGHPRTLRSGSGPRALPACTHRPTSLELRCEQEGDTWQMWSRGPWGSLSRIKVQRNRTATVKLGPPLLIKPQVDIFQGQVFVSLRIFGRAGEQYTNLICRNDRRIAVPQVKIVDEAGTVLASGAFQYG